MVMVWQKYIAIIERKLKQFNDAMFNFLVFIKFFLQKAKILNKPEGRPYQQQLPEEVPSESFLQAKPGFDYCCSH